MTQTYSQGYAVVIGVGADLPVTIDDARAVSDMLIDPDRCAYPANQVRLLVSEQARRESLVASLEWLAASTDPGDTAVVYFSGHGMETPDFHLVPYGFDGRDLGGTAVSGAEFTSLLRSIKASKLLVLLDCCHAGGQAEAKGFIKSPIPPNAIEELGRGEGRVIIASSRRDEVSWTGHPYSEFTAATLEALAGYGAFEQDGFGRVLDLALYVGRHVPERTRDRQHPIIKVSNLQDNFAIAYYAAGDLEPKALPWSATLSALESHTTAEANDGRNEQARTWRRMLKNYQENLLLIEERMSEYVEFASMPLQLVRSKQVTEANIIELEAKLRGGHNA